MKGEHRSQEWSAILGEVQERDSELGSAIYGAFLFHQWAASHLPREVRAHYGDRFVLGAHHLLEDHFSVLSGVRKRFYRQPDPSVIPVCRECKCKPEDAPTDRKPDPSVIPDCLLIDRFHCAYKDITSDNVAEWYFGLFVPDAINVRAFFRVAAPSDRELLKARNQILSQELSQQVGSPATVKVKGMQTRPRVTLRDAFALTAMVAIKEWVNPSSTDMDSYAGVVADRFEFPSADSVVNALASACPEDRESGNLR